jgi:hypothetical protein
MRLRHTVAVLGLAVLPGVAAHAEAPQTVCTVTVNSADEGASLRRHLPADRFRFVELVQRGRTDWLDAACRSGVRCDVLVVSAHHDAHGTFYADPPGQPERFTAADLERLSCSGACPALFSQVKEAYLFGCNTLNPHPLSDAPAEVLRSLLRAGPSRSKARQTWQSLAGVHAQSRRDRMQLIFAGVPVIYGFTGIAPLGPVAAGVLEGHLRRGGGRDVGRGRPSRRLLKAFSAFGLAAAPGVNETSEQAQARADMCQWADERRPAHHQLAFVHRLLQRPVGEVRLSMDRVQRLMNSLGDTARQQPEVAVPLSAIAGDHAARARLLGYARQTDRPPVQLQLFDLAHALGWLTDAQRRDERIQWLSALHRRRDLGVPEVDLACSLGLDGPLDGAPGRPPARHKTLSDDVAHAALRACLGHADDRTRLLQAVVSAPAADVPVVQAYLRHRPVTDAVEWRLLVEQIAAMPSDDRQVLALESLRYRSLDDRAVVLRLAQLFAVSRSAAVQSAIAGLLIRADPAALDGEALTPTLVNRRLSEPGGGPLIDLLLDLLQAHLRAVSIHTGAGTRASTD